MAKMSVKGIKMNVGKFAGFKKVIGPTAAFISVAGILAGAVACKSRLFNSQNPKSDAASDKARDSWPVERARRQHELDTYLAKNAKELRAFTSIPMAHIGIPYMIFRILPEMFPEYFGSFGPDFKNIGMGPNPYATDARVPLGFGYSVSKAPFIQVVTLTCGACHVGRVRVDQGNGEGPKEKLLVGAPNTRADLNRFTDAVGQSILSPKFTEENVRAVLDAKPAGWFYANPVLETAERQLYKILLGKIVKAAREGIGKSRAHRDMLLTNRTYGERNGAMNFYDASPGRNDAFGLVLIHVLDEASATQGPAQPTIVDIMSVWKQKDRAINHWGGDTSASINSAVGAAFGIAGNTDTLGRESVNASNAFIQDLPSPPYPFEVDSALAARGENLFEHNCASCHKPRETRVFPAASTGTDPARARLLTPFAGKKFDDAVREGCLKTVPKKDCEGPIVIRTAPDSGYAATPLDGIWARAPYLHNGSVPTLKQLLVPSSRATKFNRGSLDYDTKEVGFAWKDATEGTVPYDTTLVAQKNTGHDSAEFLGGVDWSTDESALAALLEYLKTL